MKKFLKKFSVKKALYAILTFVLSLCIVGVTTCGLLCFSVFDKGFLTDALNNSNYYRDLCDEITDDLKDIGDASGLDKSFFEGFVNEVFVRQDVQDYINKFYSGDKLKVDNRHFDESLRTALDAYIQNNRISDYDTSGINYFVKEATKIYVSNIELKYFDALQALVQKYSSVTLIIIIICLGIAVADCLVIILTNEWKHKAVRYIAYATGSAALFNLIIPGAVLLSGLLKKITIISRSLNDMYMACLNTIFVDMLIISGVLFVFYAALILVHGKIRTKSV